MVDAAVIVLMCFCHQPMAVAVPNKQEMYIAPIAEVISWDLPILVDHYRAVCADEEKPFNRDKLIVWRLSETQVARCEK